MKRWTPGQTITDQHAFAIPADCPIGRQQVQTGFYRLGTEFELGLKDAQGDTVRALPLGTLEIAPSVAVQGQPAHAFPKSFENQIRFDGYTIGPIEFHPGSTMNLDLYWTGLADMKASYTRFVHLLNQEGQLVAQQDGIPCGGQCPTSVWEAGQQVEEHVQLEVPAQAARGSYTLAVGFYEQPSLRRLKTNEGQDRVVLDSITIN